MSHIAFPYHVLWQLTNRCNFRCIHCSASSGASVPNELSFADIAHILKELKGVGVLDLGFSGGEPLLRRDIFEILSLAVEEGFSVGLGTNGWNLNQGSLEELKRCRIHRVQISVDGLSAAHDEIRRPGSFDRAIEFARRAIAAGLKIHFCYTPQRRNLHDFEALVSLAADLGVTLFNVSQFVPVGRGAVESDLSPREYCLFLRRWTEIRQAYQGRMELRSHLAQLALLNPELQTRPEFCGCAAGRGQACISPEGYVTPCVLIPVPVGDLKQASFRDIWRSSDLIQRLQAPRVFKGKCGSCQLINKCGGCRAAALARHGDMFAEDPHCWIESQRVC